VKKIITPLLFESDSPSFTTHAVKPDFVLINKTKKTAVLVEVSVPYDAFLDICFQNKFNKYYPLCCEINELGYRASVIVLIVGSLGHIHSKFVSGLMSLGLRKFESKILCKYLSTSTIIGSYKVWKLRCKNHPF
jgi:hypothetical protein